METHPTDSNQVVRRFEQLKRTIRRRKHTGVMVLISVTAALLIAAQRQPDAKAPIMPGWVVVQKGSTGDDTEAIQAAIDSVVAGLGTT